MPIEMTPERAAKYLAENTDAANADVVTRDAAARREYTERAIDRLQGEIAWLRAAQRTLDDAYGAHMTVDEAVRFVSSHSDGYSISKVYDRPGYRAEAIRSARELIPRRFGEGSDATVGFLRQLGIAIEALRELDRPKAPANA